MFSRKVFSVTLRATRTASLLSAPKRQHTFAPLGLVCPVLCRTYAVRRGASSRPVKVKEPITDHKSTGAVSPHSTEEAQVSSQYQQAQSPYEYQDYGGRTASQVIDSNASLQAFLKRSMTTTGAGIGISAAATAVFMQFPALLSHYYICMGVGALTAIGSLLAMQAAVPATYVRVGEVVKAVDSPARQALFGAFLVGEGLAIAPMMYMVAATTPMAIPVAGALAVGTMAGMMAYALKQPQGSLAKWGPALYVGVFGLIGVGLVNMFVQSSILSMASAAVGIGIFSAFTAYDTHIAIQDHNEGRPDHLLTAANFYLNFINLFLDYLRIIRQFFD